jgi:hypothetical protein
MSRRSSLRLVVVSCLCSATLTACGGPTLEPGSGPPASQTISPQEAGIDPVGPPSEATPPPGENVGVDPLGPTGAEPTSSSTTSTTEPSASTASGG